jgi:hypothetical protein
MGQPLPWWQRIGHFGSFSAQFRTKSSYLCSHGKAAGSLPLSVFPDLCETRRAPKLKLIVTIDRIGAGHRRRYFSANYSDKTMALCGDTSIVPMGSCLPFGITYPYLHKRWQRRAECEWDGQANRPALKDLPRPESRILNTIGLVRPFR